MRTWLRTLVALSFAAVATAPAVASAQQAEGFSLNRFDPSERGGEWFVLDSLDLRGDYRVAAGVVGDWARKPLVLYRLDGTEDKPLIRDQVFLNVGASLVVFSRLRVALNVPVAVYQYGNEGSVDGLTYSPPGKASLGDIRAGADVRMFGEYGGVLTMAAGVQVYIPTGKRADYTGDGKIRVIPHVLAAGDFGPLTYAARIGFQYRALDGNYAGGTLGSEIQYAAAAGLRVADKKLVVGPEFYGSTGVTSKDAFFKTLSTPAELIVGAHYTFAQQFRAGLGFGPGLTRALGTPQFRLLASLEYAPAVAVPPPPPPSDRDRDGVLDADDACPDVPGIKTDDPKTNGCPPPPSDKDGDGIIGPEDACPLVPGVRTDGPKTNGCPPDRDGDGIPDAEDACPDLPGPRDPNPKINGCPVARIEAGEIKIIQQVKFKTGSAIILPESDSILSAVMVIMVEHPEIRRVRVGGHTDNVGGKAMNKALSNRRAHSVVDWLIEHGVEPGRITSQGFGLERPIDTNGTEDGRHNNRRVEFHIESTQGPALHVDVKDDPEAAAKAAEENQPAAKSKPTGESAREPTDEKKN